ncbi:hypothetical protein [Streptomyces sp. NPDC051567]|uniref:hypothetical protein n=1 Tax=Streptomyces sp. NPDC051567 TaxID=3365660 RepID=UPI003789062D
MAENHNSRAPEGGYDAAGSTQMFRAFVEDAEPAGRTSPGARGQRRARRRSGSKAGAWLLAGLGLVAVAGVALWLVLR